MNRKDIAIDTLTLLASICFSYFAYLAANDKPEETYIEFIEIEEPLVIVGDSGRKPSATSAL